MEQISDTVNLLMAKMDLINIVILNNLKESEDIISFNLLTWNI